MNYAGTVITRWRPKKEHDQASLMSAAARENAGENYRWLKVC